MESRGHFTVDWRGGRFRGMRTQIRRIPVRVSSRLLAPQSTPSACAKDEPAHILESLDLLFQLERCANSKRRLVVVPHSRMVVDQLQEARHQIQFALCLDVFVIEARFLSRDGYVENLSPSRAVPRYCSAAGSARRIVKGDNPSDAASFVRTQSSWACLTARTRSRG